MSSQSQTVSEYLASLPPERRRAIREVRKLIRAKLPKGFKEGVQYGMIGYYVPLSRYPDTYNGRPLVLASLASQKAYMSVYLMGVYGNPKVERWFVEAYKKSGKKLDMGKCCVRFKTLEDLPLDVIGQVIEKVSLEDFLAQYEQSRSKPKSPKASKKKRTVQKSAKPRSRAQ